MKIVNRFFLSLVSIGLIAFAQVSNASTVYAVSSDSGQPAILGTADGGFYQLNDFQVITLDMGVLFTGSSQLDIFTYDDVSPASAKVEISSDNSVFTLVSNTVSDTNGVVMGSVYPSASFLITDTFRYVRITDNADGVARNLGFDLDAVGVTAVPVPAAMWLFASGLIGLVGAARRA